MLNWILSPMTRLDWLIVLAVIIALSWLSTMPAGVRFITKWSMKSVDKAFKRIDWFEEVTDDKEDGLS